ncbi:PREDICTED: pentatricopeptide repeat-containing protein At3g22670, mitochondrial [Brassica oleracea var. oleracea]|uniref:pentatricopeptide repeat-containing protein At3g22670, mitochondrial n=1 Tax=Brassica oleracea var. oleracea TaxID=109376 RepID=UPI0006A6C43F|nr:PREDICTED: pentatricopeptide repeat-containing protein At3g22670, mitochondrial [Brassica oleracea var. oleracea]
MLAKLRISKLLSSSLPRRIYERRFLATHNAFSNTDESPVVAAESPELPSWIKDFLSNKPSSSNPISDDEDFVIPSLASWVETQKLGREEASSTGNVAKKPIEDIDKVSDFLNKKEASHEEILNALSKCDVVVSETLVLQVLRRFSNGWNQAYAFFTWAKSQTGYTHSPHAYNSMVDVLGKCRNFDLMWALVDEMSELVTLDTMSKVMRRLAKSGKYSEAVDAFLEMERKYGVGIDTNAINSLMDALVKENSIEHAHEAFLKMFDTVKPDSRTFNILIHGFCKARRFDDARTMMDLMKVAGFGPDVVTYTGFVEGYCKEGDFRRVDEVLEEMRESGVKPNVVTYTIVMHSLGKARQVAEALGVYEKMREDGCVPDAKFYSSLIHILSKTGRFKDAVEIFEDMTKQGVSRDVLVYNTMISAAVHHSRDEMALRLLKRMEEEEEEGGSCSPNVETYAPLLKMCCQKKKMKLLGALLHHMVRNDVSIDVATYILLIRGLCMSGKVEVACLFFEEAMRKGMVPRDSTCKMLVEELEKKGMGEAKLKIQSLVQSKVMTKSQSPLPVA